MLSIQLICVGRLREKHYIEAFAEYEKRLRPYCRFSLTELSEERLPQNPSEAEIEAALKKEAKEILAQLSPGVFVAALCIEGRKLSSEALAALMQNCANTGRSRFCFIVGSSFGLDNCIKKRLTYAFPCQK